MRLDPAERYESAEAMAAALLGEEAGSEPTRTTATIAAPGDRAASQKRTRIRSEPVAESDGNETVPVPRMEQTARLPVPATGAPACRARSASKVALIMAAGIVATIAVVKTVLALAAFTGPGRAGGERGRGARRSRPVG